MISTRQFLKSILVAAVAPSILIPKAGDRQKWKRSGNIWRLNPEWENAPYEAKILCGEWSFVEGGPTDFIRRYNPVPMRFKQNSAGMFVTVYKWTNS